MKKIIDTKLYLGFAIVALSLSVVLACVSLYSIVFVEKEVKQLLMSDPDESENFAKAYLKLRSPQIFAGYDFFDFDDSVIKKILSYFDSKISANESIDAQDAEYLYALLDRRMLGSSLGMKTSVFLLILSLLGSLAFLYEKRDEKKRYSN